ncbi:hypothetical protein JTB14_012863 [Gonioctena quinquepunctata]|nr:hypothetical protein JTB14_012863 [Gonioctena quinquepunctata]
MPNIHQKAGGYRYQKEKVTDDGCKTREVAESLEGRTDKNKDEDVDTLPEAPLPPKETIRENPKPREHERRRQPDEVELKMIKALEEPPLSPHISFFLEFQWVFWT